VDYTTSVLAEAGLSIGPAVRVLNQELSHYVPPTRSVLGVLLLESRYAAGAFSFKTVSMLERGLHVLCYSDLAVAEYLREHDAGVLCDRSVEAVVSAIRAYENRHDRIDLRRLLASEAWDARVEGLWQDLSRA
jgi:hypothetical protein